MSTRDVPPNEDELKELGRTCIGACLDIGAQFQIEAKDRGGFNLRVYGAPKPKPQDPWQAKLNAWQNGEPIRAGEPQEQYP